jgi:hypothetical protein
MEDEKPKTSHLVLKPREIVPTDAPSRPGDGKEISARLIHQQNAVLEEKARKAAKKGESRPPVTPLLENPLPPIFKAKEIERMNLHATEGDPEGIRVEDILAENIVAEHRSGWGRIKRRGRKRSRRARDYLLVLAFMAILAAGIYRLAPGPYALAYGLGALVLVATTLGWLMFFVMDDY